MDLSYKNFMQNFSEETFRKRPLGKPRNRNSDSDMTIIREDGRWMEQVQCRVQWQALVERFQSFGFCSQGLSCSNSCFLVSLNFTVS